MPSVDTLTYARPLDDIRRHLDAGPETYSVGEAAHVLGVRVQTLSTWADRGDIARRPLTGNGTSRQQWVFHRDDLWRLAQVMHGKQPSELDASDDTRDAVLRMLARWGDCAETPQEMHDRAGVRPLPPPVDTSHGGQHHRVYVSVECPLCGEEFLRPTDSSARWSLCKQCSSRVRQRASRMAREFVAWAQAR